MLIVGDEWVIFIDGELLCGVHSICEFAGTGADECLAFLPAALCWFFSRAERRAAWPPLAPDI